MERVIHKKNRNIPNILMILVFLFVVMSGRVMAQETLTLEECLERTLEGNHELEALRNRVEAASARVDEAAAGLKPKVSLAGKYLWAGEEQRLWPARYDGERGIYDDEFAEGTAILEIPLSDGGKTRNMTKSERKLQEAAEASLERLEERLRYDVTRLFYLILAQKEAVSALETALESLRLHEKDVLAMLEAGKAARVDALRVAAEAASAEEQLLTRRHELESLKEDLLLVMGEREKAENYDLSGKFPEVGTVPDEQDLTEKALRSRSDYISALRTIDAREYGLRAAKAATNPEISLRGVHAYRSTGGGSNESRTDAELYVEFPLWDGGISSARARQAKSEKAAAEAEARGLATQIEYEISEALRAYDVAERKTAVTRTALESAEEGLRIEKLKFRAGKGTTTDVLSAHAAWLSAMANLSAARAETALADARIAFVTGGRGNE
ncbi:MAG: TolC family protein [Thermovirgaceae bacterium]